MKRKFMVASIATLGLAAAITACGDKNKKNNPTPTPTKAEYLKSTAGWVLDKMYMSINNMPEADVTAQVDACEKDDRLFFKDGGKLTVDQGALKCNSSAPQTSEETYALIANDTKIILSGDTADIVTLNATQLSIKLTTVQNNVPMVVRQELKH